MLTIVLFGASGDLARRKTVPAVFGLHRRKLLPTPFKLIGYARSELSRDQFIEKLMPFLKKAANTEEAQGQLQDFLRCCDYMHGRYDDPSGYQKLAQAISAGESEDKTAEHTRIFYLALPPSLFVTVAQNVREYLYKEGVANRLVVEKPFGRDSKSAAALIAALSKRFSEDEIFRIDHYLGKEMVKNIMALRFANLFFNAVWNRQCIASVQIVFKETLGIEGRGGFFDENGIIRDVMQNHMLQMMTVVAMERPARLNSSDIHDEKAKVLKCVPPLRLEDVILGQYGPSPDGSKKGYAREETVPSNSIAPTFAMAVMYVNNERWDGVPFIFRCGKGLNEQKSEIRIQFTDVPGQLFEDGSKIARNELVLRVSPSEAVYLKMMVKRPGLETELMLTDLDLSYSSRFKDASIPEAYEALLLDVFRNDHSNFVRSDELQLAWDIFTPVLERIEKELMKPIVYPFGSRGPEEAYARLRQLGYHHSDLDYSWPVQHVKSG